MLMITSRDRIKALIIIRRIPQIDVDYLTDDKSRLEEHLVFCMRRNTMQVTCPLLLFYLRIYSRINSW